MQRRPSIVSIAEKETHEPKIKTEMISSGIHRNFRDLSRNWRAITWVPITTVQLQRIVTEYL